jgi:hypothetical protein
MECDVAKRTRTAANRESIPDQAVRDQEVLRARRELAAYFKGRRTEREARSALKIIKAFVRHREKLEPKSRPPLPGRNLVPSSLESRTHVPPRKQTD